MTETHIPPASNPMKRPPRTISDALRDEEIDRALRRGEYTRVKRDPARQTISEGGYYRQPMRYDQ